MEAHPLDVLLDGIHIFGVFLRGIRVVVAEVGLAAVFLGEPEVDAQAFGVPEVEITVRLRGETRHDAGDPSGFQVVLDYLFEEIQFLRLGRRGILCFFHCQMIDLSCKVNKTLE